MLPGWVHWHEIGCVDFNEFGHGFGCAVRWFGSVGLRGSFPSFPTLRAFQYFFPSFICMETFTEMGQMSEMSENSSGW
jgi:hypothetical protein